jgi:hypothetical protein
LITPVQAVFTPRARSIHAARFKLDALVDVIDHEGRAAQARFKV